VCAGISVCHSAIWPVNHFTILPLYHSSSLPGKRSRFGISSLVIKNTFNVRKITGSGLRSANFYLPTPEAAADEAKSLSLVSVLESALFVKNYKFS